MNKEKILAALTAISGQYNLPKEQLEKIAALAPADLAEDGLQTWAESQKGIMALMQSYADSRVTANSKELQDLKKENEDLKKAAEEAGKKTPETDLEKALGTLRKELEDSFEAKLKVIQDENSELKKKVGDGETAEKERQFGELKKRVAKELGLSDKALGLLESKLTSDMDETKVNEILSAGKKDLVEMGLHNIEDGKKQDLDSSAAAKERADKFLDELQKKQQQQNAN